LASGMLPALDPEAFHVVRLLSLWEGSWLLPATGVRVGRLTTAAQVTRRLAARSGICFVMNAFRDFYPKRSILSSNINRKSDFFGRYNPASIFSYFFFLRFFLRDSLASLRFFFSFFGSFLADRFCASPLNEGIKGLKSRSSSGSVILSSSSPTST
jgi:hypothetical protein